MNNFGGFSPQAKIFIHYSFFISEAASLFIIHYSFYSISIASPNEKNRYFSSTAVS